MFFINMVDPWSLLIALFLTICFVYIGKEAKKSYVPLLPLIVYLLLLVMHVVQYIFNLPIPHENPHLVLSQCILVECIMIYVSYISYLWVNAIEGKSKAKRAK